jgi:hypothetical protein
LALTYAGVRTERHKYGEHAIGEKELYNLDSDPFGPKSRHGPANLKLTKSF